MRHTIFVGGSTENIVVAQAIEENLKLYGHIVQCWPNVFSIMKNAFDSLLDSLSKVDAAVFVFAPDDLVRIRGERFDSIRDNVVFELGLFTGRLGRDRTFWVVPKGQHRLRIASDLLGLLPAEYDVPKDGNWASALEPACSQIHIKLIESARERGRKQNALSIEKTRACMGQVNGIIQHVTSLINAGTFSPQTDRVEVLSDQKGFRICISDRLHLTVTFGCIEDFCCDIPGSVVALPANEFFDDDCINDSRSALGSFVMKHFATRLDEFKCLVSQQLKNLRPIYVERQTRQYQESYGVGTSLWIEASGDPALRLILSAVTRMRAGEGLMAEPTYVLACIQSIARIMQDKRLTHLHVPLFGSGHGEVDKEVALLCLVFALVNTPKIRHANIVVFRKTPTSDPDIHPVSIRRILNFVATANKPAEARK